MNGPARILVVDDNREVLFATARMLKSGGYEVLEASSGRQCLDIAGQKKPDLILLDVVMPDMEGPEVCRRIKEDPEMGKALVVLVSGLKTSPDSQADGLDMGADGYITRPFTQREFLSRVVSMLRIKKAEDDLREALGRVRRLEGILPICMHCKSIRNDKELWQKFDDYLTEHSDALLSHSLCPECIERYYPGQKEIV